MMVLHSLLVEGFLYRAAHLEYLYQLEAHLLLEKPVAFFVLVHNVHYTTGLF